MANIKKYNPENQSWETWASNSATGVYSTNPTLLPEEEQITTVEDALVRDREDIDLMKKNISWLALHGGGGSGSGSGGNNDVTNSIDILNENNSPSTELIWKSTSKNVKYQITSSKASNKFNVTATLDGYTIYSETGISQGVIRSININRIGAHSNSTRHVIRISAVDSWDNVVTAQAIINESAVKLNKTNDTYTVNIDEITGGTTLTLNYQTSIIGDYVLYWGNSSDIDINSDHRIGWKELGIRSSFAEDVVIPYWATEQRNRLLINNEVRSGQTLTFYFILININDPTIKSEILEVKSTVVSPRELAIQPISLSTEVTEATRISKASIMPCNFIVYLNATSLRYDYTITANKIVLNDQTNEWEVIDTKVIIDNNSGTYGNVTVVTYNALPREDFFEAGYTYRFDIYAEDRMDRTKHNTAYSYVEIQSASNNVIPIEADNKKIFEFNVWGDRGLDDQTWIWTSTNEGFNHAGENKTVTTTMTLKNMGGKSTLEPTHCRLTNKAYAVINASTLNGTQTSWFPNDTNSSLSGLISAGAPQFTLSIAYFNDFTPDDNRTILNYGNYVPATSEHNAYGRGILINNHDFYVKLGPNSPLVTGKIQDSIYHKIDIVVGRGNVAANNTVSVEVYHNGVLLAINKDIPASDIFGLSSYNEMSIACYKQGDNLSQYTNIKLQSVSLYAIALNPYQIVCDWINHLVTYELDNNALNTTLLNEKLQSNLITANNDGTYSCPIWDNDSFDTHNWIQVNNGQLSPDGNLHQICPIPIVILDLSSNSNWTWERFKQSWAGITQPDAENVPMYFYNQYGGSTVLNNVPVTVSGQGTTSKAYAIKNLNIDFGEDRLFWARQNWFPERTYTLKADIVDSAHVNNACIGKFVNTCAQNTTLLAPTPPMQYFNDNKENNNLFNLPQTAIENDGVTIKHTLEGFPVLLLVRFLRANGTTTNQSLGIYSFNLGRESYYNMGFKVLKQFRDVDGSIASDTTLAPCLLGAPNESEDVIDFNAQSWEGRDSFNCSEKTANTELEIDTVSNGGYATSVNATMPVQLDGYFWSSYPDHIRHFWENKYPGSANISDFQDLCLDLVQCPYVKGSSYINWGANVYQYDWNGSNYFVPAVQSTNVEKIGRLNKDNASFNIPNARFYYVVCMLFGLVDSLGKNLNMRIWKNTHIQDLEAVWYTCFYDMDTAMGIDNVGAEIVQPDVLDEELYNDPELVRQFAYGTYGNEKMYTVRDNKLWGILDHPQFKDQFGVSGGVGGNASSRNSLYAAVWNFIRTNYLRSADDFMNNYFDNQTTGVGELLYNQDFDVKYIGTPQTNYMYGDRKAFVRDWITKRIKFLDSYFGYLQSSGSESYLEDPNIEDCSYKNIIKIKHRSGTDYIPVVTNAPCIITTTIGGQTISNYYVPANTPTNIRMSNSIGTAGIQTQINNSDLLLEIQDLANLSVQSFESSETKLIDTGGEYVDDLYSKQYGSLSSFTKFNVSGNTTFENNGIDFIKLFKTWNEGENTLPYTLTELNLSNTKNNNVTNFQLNLKSSKVGLNGANYYQNPFENLTDINIINSCVTGVTLPDNIALNSLQIAGSAIENVTLNGQSILKNVDFSNCIALNSVILNNCTAFEKLRLSGAQLLNTVDVGRCASLDEVSIDMSGSNTAITVRIDEVPNLKKISISNVRNTNSIVSIIASGLEELSLEGCEFSEIILSSECKNTLQSLNISNSLVNRINWDNSFEGDYLDLSDCPALVAGGINVVNNTAITKVQLPNIENDPVNLNFAFTGCVNLERIYGNLNINSERAFADCTKFKLHDGKFGIDKDHLNNVIVNNRQLHLADQETYEYIGYSNTKVALADVFQQGKEVTNLVINIESPTEAFKNTNVDAFDVYYILRHLGPNVRDISGMFMNCPNIHMQMTINVDNSPHWTMFEKCGNITNISNLFAGNTDMGPFRLYGNHSDDGGHIGLFTPLVNCTNFNSIFNINSHDNIWFIADKNTFKLANGQYFGGANALISINEFCPRDIYTNLNDMSDVQAFTAYYSDSDASISEFERGNLKGFFSGFSRLPNTLSYVLHRLRYMNFGTNNNVNESDTMDKLPLEVTSVNNCFCSTNSTGNVILQRLFTKNQNNEYNVTSISNSFSGSLNSIWQLDNNSLFGFTKLVTFANVFSGVNKLLNDINFPYHIFDPCASTITDLSGFFRNASGTVQNAEIPGTLFMDCVNLQNISGCFSYLNIDFTLTPNGFINCPMLNNVSRLFEWTTRSLNAVPNHFFNTGFIDSVVSITGAQTNEQTINVPVNADEHTWVSAEYLVQVTDGNTRTITRYKNVTVENDSIIKCNPTSMHRQDVYEYNGLSYMLVSSSNYEYIMSYNSWNPTTITISKHTPRRSISDMSYLFSRSSFPKYQHTLNLDSYDLGGDVEPNPDYCPFNYVYENGSWTTVNNENKEFTFMWAFDGDWTQALREMNLSNYLLVDEIPYNIKSENSGGTDQLFGCTPDLLRWCTVNPNIDGLFSRSSYTGRIVPYLLKPVPNLTSFAEAFSWNESITAYSTNANQETYVTIPPTFFEYTPNLTNLKNTFALNTFYTSPNVFGSLRNSLNVEGIFSNCIWNGGTSTNKFQINGVFASNKIANCKNAFEGSYSEASRTQYIQFNNVFSTVKAIHPESADDHVFYGYTAGPNNNKSLYVTHENPPTCSTIPGRKNYSYYGE